MTAEELIAGLRERGYTIRRSRAPGLMGYVLIPRVADNDKLLPWFRQYVPRGVQNYIAEHATPSRKRVDAWEVNLRDWPVDLPPVEGDETTEEHAERRRVAVWLAAKP